MLVSDFLLLDYKRCQRRAYLNLYGEDQERRPERDFLLKLRQESQKHIAEVLTAQFPHYQEPETPTSAWRERAQETKTMMASGVDVIYRGYLTHTLPLGSQELELELELISHPHLLVKTTGQSRWGPWQYQPVSIQLGRRPKPEYKILSTFHAQLLAVYQGRLPQRAEIILRRQNTHWVDLEEWLPRFHQTLADCVQTLVQRQEPEVFISRQRCNLCHWYDHCYAIAQEQQHLSLVPGVTPSRYESLQTAGVCTIDSLARLQAAQVAELIGTAIASQLQQQALALIEKRALLKQGKGTEPLVTGSVELYFDIEAEPERNLDYLLGVVVVDRVNRWEKFYGFLAQTPEEEEAIWRQFVQLTQTYPEAPIYHFSEYERETIKRLGKLYGTPAILRGQMLERCFDLHHYVVNHVICPVESYSLKSLASWLGFQWRDAMASGDQSVCWYDNWLSTGDRQFLDLILRYNEDDCRATLVLKDWLAEFLFGFS